MSVSLHVIGLRDLDGKFAKMIAVKNACEAAGVSYPKELLGYFTHPEESERYLIDKKREINIEYAVSEIYNTIPHGYEIDVKKLPEDVKTIRFYLS